MADLITPPYQAEFDDETEISPSWKSFFNDMFYILGFKNNHQRTFTITATSLTDSGTGTYTGSYRVFNGMLFFSVKISSTGNTSSTAGTTTIDLPLKPDSSGNNYTALKNGECVVNNIGTKISIGTGLVLEGSAKIYLPAWSTVSDDISISGSVRINDNS